MNLTISTLKLDKLLKLAEHAGVQKLLSERLDRIAYSLQIKPTELKKRQQLLDSLAEHGYHKFLIINEDSLLNNNFYLKPVWNVRSFKNNGWEQRIVFNLSEVKSFLNIINVTFETPLEYIKKYYPPFKNSKFTIGIRIETIVKQSQQRIIVIHRGT